MGATGGVFPDIFVEIAVRTLLHIKPDLRRRGLRSSRGGRGGEKQCQQGRHGGGELRSVFWHPTNILAGACIVHIQNGKWGAGGEDDKKTLAKADCGADIILVFRRTEDAVKGRPILAPGRLEI